MSARPGLAALALTTCLSLWPSPAGAGDAIAVAGSERARLDYALYCMGCHRADGSGTRDDIPRLAGQVGSFLRTPGGREFLVQVPGVAQSPLGDAALADVLNWLLAEFSAAELPPGFAPYTADELARLRARPLVDVAGTRAALLRALERGAREPRPQTAGATR